eukprot:3067256-Pyramimonas_sp.AAC.1
MIDSTVANYDMTGKALQVDSSDDDVDGGGLPDTAPASEHRLPRPMEVPNARQLVDRARARAPVLPHDAQKGKNKGSAAASGIP